MTLDCLKLVSLPFLYCACVWISVCNHRIFDTGANGVADGSMDDHLGWKVILNIG